MPTPRTSAGVQPVPELEALGKELVAATELEVRQPAPKKRDGRCLWQRLAKLQVEGGSSLLQAVLSSKAARLDGALDYAANL